MIKKVVIPAAGRGTRMRHLTKNRPKILIKVAGQPFLYYVLEILRKAGFEEMILIVGHQKEMIEDYLSNLNYSVKVVNQFEVMGEKYGTACAIQSVEKIVGQENFVVTAGDNLYSQRDLQRIARDDEWNYVGGLKHSHPEKMGVLIFDEKNYLKKIIEKPQEFVGDFINAALYKFTPEIFEKVKQIKKSPRGEYEITDAITLLAQEKKVKVLPLEDFWYDFGNPADILKLSRVIKRGELG